MRSRQSLRKDKGPNGDVDRSPLLTGVMFLKFLADLEVVHEEEAKRDGKPYHPIIESPYRWRDWAAREDGLTGDELLAVINQDECHRADGSRGAALFAYLRGLAGSGEKGSQRDAACDSGEFYTPRPVVRFMVQVTDPRLGETMLDPACGTGGFLVEAYDRIAQQVTNPDQRRTLQHDTLLGQEAKPLLYMLAQMNLLLHGLEAPQIAYGNTLERRITEIGHSELGGRDPHQPALRR